ncbi:zinc knuckle CX2CX4HX4C containing protein, partial [Tanacetum coccineum]
WVMEKRGSADDDPGMVHNKTKAVKSITTQDDNGDVPNNSETMFPNQNDVNVPNGVDYDVWLPLASVNEFASIEGVESVLLNGPWMIHEIPIFLNKWSPSVSLFKLELSHVFVWVKFHDVSLVTYTSDGLSLIAAKIGTLMMLDSYINSMCLESWWRSNYARILIEINDCKDFSDHLVMAVPNLE